MSRRVTILHTNDLHDRQGLFEPLRRQPRDEGTLLLDVGDSLKGSNTLFYWNEPIVGMMNEAGYQAQAMGNREFHYLRGVLARREALRRFPLLASNLHDVRDRANHLWRRSVVLEAGGFKVGLCGVTPVQYGPGSAWLPLTGFRFYHPLEVLPDIIRDLRRECHLVVLLSHSGYRLDQRLAAELPRVDAIIGGHSHTLLREPTWVQDVPIVQTGCYGRFLGRCRFDMSESGSPESFSYDLIPMAAEAEVMASA